MKAIVRSAESSSEYIVQDASGHLWKLDTKKRAAEKHYHFHAGVISGIDVSPVTNNFVSLGVDGSLRVFDVAKMKSTGRTRYTVQGTTLQFAPKVSLS